MITTFEELFKKMEADGYNPDVIKSCYEEERKLRESLEKGMDRKQEADILKRCIEKRCYIGMSVSFLCDIGYITKGELYRLSRSRN